jgi:hypothetical protein
LLVEAEPAVGDRAVRKEIRRSLYRLRQRGVPVPDPAPPAPGPKPATEADAEGFVSAFDPRGDRVVWLVRAQPTGGALLVAATLNEPDGLRDVHAGEASRKQIRAVRQRMEAEAKIRLVSADWRVLDALLVEAHERTGGGTAERDWLRLRPRLTTEAPRPPAEPRPAASHRERGRGLRPAAASAALLGEPEPGLVSDPRGGEALRRRDHDGARARSSSRSRAGGACARGPATRRHGALPARGARPPARGDGLRPRRDGRAAPARQALAVARLLRERPGDALDVPFVAALVERGVGSLLAETTAREEERGAARSS